MAYDLLDPIGGYRHDLNAAIIAQTIANSNRASKDSPIYRLKDFMIDFDKAFETEEDKTEAMVLAAKSWTVVKGGKVISKQA